MLTQLDDMTLVRYGTRYRTRYLLEQARYTLKLAQGETPPLELPGGYLERIERAIAALEVTRDDRELAGVESQLATMRQNGFVAEGKIWRRKVTTRARRAARLGANIPKELLTIGQAHSVPKLLDSMGTMLRLLKEFELEMSCAGPVEPLLDEGRKVHHGLAEADAEQEVKRLQELPSRVRDLYRMRGELYVGLKVVNDAGRERHIRDSHRASRYSLSILHRRGARHGEPEESVEPSTNGAS